MRATQRYLIAGFIIPLSMLLDQWTKSLILGDPRFNARGCLEGGPCGRVDFLPNLIDFQMVWNRGLSYGAFQADGIWRWVLVVVTIAITIGFAIWLFRASHWLTATALSFIVAGAFGNVIDRIRFGAVVDFIDVSDAIPVFPWVFNVADSAVTVGAVLILLDQLILSQRDAKN